MAPSRYLRHLGLGHLQEHGETDALLVMAVHQLDALRCPCGCGQYVDQAHNPDTQGRWQPHVVDCYAGNALREFRKDHEGELEDKLVHLELLPEGQTARDPLEYDPVRARAEYEAHQRRHGQE